MSEVSHHPSAERERQVQADPLVDAERSDVQEAVQHAVQEHRHLEAPANYEKPTTYPQYQVAEVKSGVGSFAPQLGTEYCFTSEQKLRAYLQEQRVSGFRDVIELTRWDNERSGSVLSE